MASATTTIYTNRRPQTVQNVVLIWLDGKVQEDSEDFRTTMQKLRAIINDVNFFRKIDECVDFLKKLQNEKALILTSGALGKELVKQIHLMKQVHTIYVFCSDVTWHRGWTKDWFKVKDAYSDIRPLSVALEEAVKESNEDSIPIQFAPLSINEGQLNTQTNRLEATFMYTKIFKNILLNMEHDPRARLYLANYCRTRYAGNQSDLSVIKEFENGYQPDQAVWWYTRECFIYQLLNRALRLFESDVIVNMGFFIHDLHRQIEKLQREQRHRFGNKTLVLYRGQGLSTEDFGELKKRKGQLMSFNNFLSTSEVREAALKFTDRATGKENTVAVLFVLTIDPTITSTTFAFVRAYSYAKDEEEILFCMHTVFRIGDVSILNKDRGHHQVELTLTSDDDPKLQQIGHRIETSLHGSTGWARLGQLLMYVGELNKAEELYFILLEKATTEKEKAEYLSRLGMIKDEQGKYQEAKGHYDQALAIKQAILPKTDPSIADSFTSLGGVYLNMKDYVKATSSFKSALDIYEKMQPPSKSSIASSYNNIGSVYARFKKNDDALWYYQKALAIEEEIFEPNHLSLATTYNNIGLVYVNKKEFPTAISYFKKTLAIEEEILPPTAGSLATSYINMSVPYYRMGEYREALSYLQKASAIANRAFNPTHPTRRQVDESIHMVKRAMEKS